MTTLERGPGATPGSRDRRRHAHPMAKAGIVAFAPAWLLGALLWHPFIPDLTDKASVAAAMTPDTVRWGLSHLAVAVGAALLVLAFLALHRYLGDPGERGWTWWAIPFIVLGSTLFALLPGMEIAMLGAVGAGADTTAVLVAMDPWFVPILLAGSITFAIGILAFAEGLVRARVLGTGLTWAVAVLLVLSATTRFVPSHPALALGGVALVAALWPLALAMYKRPEPARTEAS